MWITGMSRICEIDSVSSNAAFFGLLYAKR